MSIKGIDVSAWQGATIDWPAVAGAGASFAFCKLSEGSGYLDPTFPRNWAAVGDTGLVRGAYHFARPDRGTAPEAEAAWFLDHLPALAPGDLLALDMEVPADGTADLSQWALAWLHIVAASTGFLPLLYTGRWYAADLGRLTDPALGRFPLWDAAYGPAARPPGYGPWARSTLWQHTDQASYPTIGQCDESLFDGAAADLRALGRLGYATPQPPALPHYELTTAMHVRPAPYVAALPLGPLLPVGTRVVELPAPRGLAMDTGQWAWCRTSGDVQGYLLKSNMRTYVP